MQIEAIIIAAITGLIILSLGIMLLNLTSGRKNVSYRVGKIAQTLNKQKTEEEYNQDLYYPEEKISGTTATLKRILELFGISTRKYESLVQLRFAQAGIYSPDAIIYYVFMKKFGLPIAILVAIILISGESTGLMRALGMMSAFFVVIFGLIGADLYLKNRKDKRQVILQRSFPDALDLILVCVESGLALDAALARVTRELEHAHPEITKELNKTRMELTLLNDRPRALQNLAERTDLVPFKALVGALLQSERFGTSLTETLRVLSDDYRHTRLMLAEQKAGRLPALMTIPMMMLMMPAFVIIIMGPAILSFLDVWNQSGPAN